MKNWYVYLDGKKANVTVSAESEADALVLAEDELELTDEESELLRVVEQ